MSRDELIEVITAELDQLARVPMPGDSVPSDQGTAQIIARIIRGVALAIEQNNERLAQQIIEALQGGDSPS